MPPPPLEPFFIDPISGERLCVPWINKNEWEYVEPITLEQASYLVWRFKEISATPLKAIEHYYSSDCVPNYSITTDITSLAGEGVLFFNYKTDTHNVSIEFEARAADATDIWKRYKPEDAFDDPSDIKDITDTKTPIALIHNNPDPPDDPTPADRYVVKQLARNNMVINGSCFNGVVLRVFIPL